MRVSVTIPDEVVAIIDKQAPSLCGVSSGRSRWILNIILKHLQLPEDYLFDHNNKRGKRK